MIKLNQIDKYYNRHKRNELHILNEVSLSFDPDGLIANKKLGIVAGNDYLILKKSILSLLNNSGLRAKLGQNAKIFSSDNFSLEKKINNFIELLTM